ncbi:MAG: hypothetical protein RR915_05750 [Cellulosilyticaceae bacterium]
MKMMKKSFAVLALVGIVVSMSACSKADVPQEYNPVEATAPTEAKEVEKVAEAPTVETSAPVAEKEEGLKLIMTAATEENKIEGSDGLGFYGVYTEGEDEAAIADAIGKNHFFATQAEGGPVIKITAKEYMMGDSAKIDELVKFKVDVKNLKSGSIVKVVTAEGVVLEEKVMGDKYTGRIDAEAKGFYRVEVYTADGELLAVSSPITIQE